MPNDDRAGLLTARCESARKHVRVVALRVTTARDSVRRVPAAGRGESRARLGARGGRVFDPTDETEVAVFGPGNRRPPATGFRRGALVREEPAASVVMREGHDSERLSGPYRAIIRLWRCRAQPLS